MALATFTLADGTPVAFETDVQPGLQPAGPLGDQFRGAQLALEASLVSIRRAAAAITDTFVANLPEQPDEVEVTFAIKASAEVNGFIFAKGAAEGNCEITLTWKKPA